MASPALEAAQLQIRSNFLSQPMLPRGIYTSKFQPVEFSLMKYSVFDLVLTTGGQSLYYAIFESGKIGFVADR
jgi:hypothetical protein